MLDARGRHVTNYVEGQDIMAWVTQGAITDRTTEHLGPLGHRRRDAAQDVPRADGSPSSAAEDPLGTIREPHERIDLPCEKDKFHAGGAQFALDFCDMGSTRFSPVLDTIKKIHIAAAEKMAAERSANA